MTRQPVAGSETIHVARSEYKYQVFAEQIPAIREWLLRYCVPDENSRSGEWYAVRSLYLDNAQFRLYQDAKDALPFRFKLRVRAYGDASGSIKLEVKRRVRELIVKRSATVRPEAWQLIQQQGEEAFLDLATPAMGEFLQLQQSLAATPRMLVYYERQAFSSTVDNYVRVTFDRCMQCQPMRDWRLHGDPAEWRPVDAPRTFGETASPYVLEIKFLDAPPAWLRDLVLRFDLERRGFSKYGRAVESTILQEERAWELIPGLRSSRWSAA